MCSPHIHQQVLQRIEREGAPKLSRRNLLKFGGMAAAGFALTGSGLSVQYHAAPGRR
jgi:hypothetical protein